MYYASSHTRMSKTKSPCTLVTVDGHVLNGNFFCSGDQRIKDVLNGEAQFVAFEDDDGEIHLINRNNIARVAPRPVADKAPFRTVG
jgi:hypothetical protein